MLNKEILNEAVYTSRIEGSTETVASTIKLQNIKSVYKKYDLKFGTQLSLSQKDFLNNSKYYNISLSKYANKYNLE